MASESKQREVSIEREEKSWQRTATFTGDEPYFRDHFPGFPVVPGVLLFEAMRETSLEGLLTRGEVCSLTRVTHLRFARPCIPPIDVQVNVRMDPENNLAMRCEVLDPNGRKLSTARLFFEKEA